MIWFDEKSPSKGLNWNPNFPYDDLKPEQELYGIISGIGSDAHFGGDYRIGLSLGLGRDSWKSWLSTAKSTPNTQSFTTRRNCGARCAELDLARD